jgi:hypothetical protein
MLAFHHFSATRTIPGGLEQALRSRGLQLPAKMADAPPRVNFAIEQSAMPDRIRRTGG